MLVEDVRSYQSYFNAFLKNENPLAALQMRVQVRGVTAGIVAKSPLDLDERRS